MGVTEVVLSSPPLEAQTRDLQNTATLWHGSTDTIPLSLRSRLIAQLYCMNEELEGLLMLYHQMLLDILYTERRVASPDIVAV